MKIVVLDGYALNPGDLSWVDLEGLGELTVYDRTSDEDIAGRAEGAEIVITNKTVLSAGIIEQLEDLRYICVLATGYNVVDVEAARSCGVAVSNVPTYGTDSVAQMVFAHLLNLTLNVGGHAESVSRGEWGRCVDFCYWQTPLIELCGLTMGIVGMGRIGRAVAKIAIAFGMKVLACDVARPESVPAGCVMADMDDVFREADVVSLHCPLTEETERLVNAQRLGMMKKGAFLINTSRGGLVDEGALAEALNDESIAGAGLDVLSAEPPEEDNPLIEARNCYITPHIAWATHAARRRLLDTVVGNVRAFTVGQLQNVVN